MANLTCLAAARHAVLEQAGNVNKGAFDPIAEVCERARAPGAWVHVDGAFGLRAKASPRRAHLVQGMKQADSWSTDAHKWLNVPYDSGIALVRDRAALAGTMAVQAACVSGAQSERNPFDYSPELPRRARGVSPSGCARAAVRSWKTSC